MDKDLEKLITETMKSTFADAPEKLIERGLREIQYDICPHCQNATVVYEAGCAHCEIRLGGCGTFSALHTSAM